MRILSGKYKGRTIAGYDIVGTRPTMDRIKESLFAMLNRNLKDAVCLDLFAGSGNLGLEAISNGARCCYFVDKSKQAIKTIKNNVANLNIVEAVYLIEANYTGALKQLKKDNIKFDIIFIDPPYQDKIIDDILNYIYKNDLLNDNGLIICEYEFYELNSHFYSLYKERVYGTKKIRIFKKENI